VPRASAALACPGLKDQVPPGSNAADLVRAARIERAASAMSRQRSAAELRARYPAAGSNRRQPVCRTGTLPLS
jgi:hypothetical protein